MSKRKSLTPLEWFSNCGSWPPHHDLGTLRRGIKSGMLDEQDESGMTALSLAVTSSWSQGVEELLRLKADTELRYFRTGQTALFMAMQTRNEPIIAALVAAGANPDAPNYWGVTARIWASHSGSTCFDRVPLQTSPLPPARIQNAEHLADHYHPRFEIPTRAERETLQVGQAVDLYVYGPKEVDKQDTVKVRISARREEREGIRYVAIIETPADKIHLPSDTRDVEFGPENVASVYRPQPVKAEKAKTAKKKRKPQ